MFGRHDNWRLACVLAKQQDKEPAIVAELVARGISTHKIGEMLALAAWAIDVMNPLAADACDLEIALEIAQRQKLLDERDLAARRATLVACC